MDALIIIIKALLLSVFVIFCFQIKWEGQTIEERTITQIENSGVSEFVHDVALGGINAANDLYRSLLDRWSEYQSTERATR